MKWNKMITKKKTWHGTRNDYYEDGVYSLAFTDAIFGQIHSNTRAWTHFVILLLLGYRNISATIIIVWCVVKIGEILDHQSSAQCVRVCAVCPILTVGLAPYPISHLQMTLFFLSSYSRKTFGLCTCDVPVTSTLERNQQKVRNKKINNNLV